MNREQHFIYLYWIDDPKWGGGHLKIGFSKRPYKRYKSEAPLSHPIRTIPLGYLDESQARREEQSLKLFMQKKIRDWSEKDGFDPSAAMITEERFRLPLKRQIQTMRIFNMAADKVRESRGLGQ